MFVFIYLFSLEVAQSQKYGAPIANRTHSYGLLIYPANHYATWSVQVFIYINNKNTTSLQYNC